LLFNTLDFWLFFALVAALYPALPLRQQNRMLLLASWFFYACWDWRFLSLLLLSTAIDFWVGLRIGATRDRAAARRWVAVSATSNLTLLGFFKYFDFFVGSASALLERLGLGALGGPQLHVVLPVGISFYTFQSMSYAIDVYRGELKPTRDAVDFALFVAFFPQLVAGPIMRARDLLPQIQRARRPRFEDVASGLHLAAVGLVKKVVIADNLALIVNPIFRRELGFQPGVLHLGALAFAFQIYCDFSGYSDIARGTGRALGFDLMENFRHPYTATCITDFWRRWHVSLSTWLRDYLYVPLGGNRGGRWRTYRNLMLTMLLGGLWHGAAWTFVIWGGYQGLLLSAERALGGKRLIAEPGAARSPLQRLVRLVRVLATFHLVCLGWIYFRAESVAPLLAMTARFASPLGWLRMPAGPTLEVLALVVPLLAFEALQRGRADELPLLRWPVPVRGVVYAGMAWAFILFGRFESNAFIYFQF